MAGKERRSMDVLLAAQRQAVEVEPEPVRPARGTVLDSADSPSSSASTAGPDSDTAEVVKTGAALSWSTSAASSCSSGAGLVKTIVSWPVSVSSR
jgi:hypothetical protein